MPKVPKLIGTGPIGREIGPSKHKTAVISPIDAMFFVVIDVVVVFFISFALYQREKFWSNN